MHRCCAIHVVCQARTDCVCVCVCVGGGGGGCTQNMIPATITDLRSKSLQCADDVCTDKLLQYWYYVYLLCS
jgi:hypothetical protein